MSKILIPIHTTEKNRERLRYDCKQIFLKYHPDFLNVKISDDFILEKVITKYIEDDING